MTASIDWWAKPRTISVVVDNASWVLPYAEQLVTWAASNGDQARLCRTHNQIAEGGIAFYLGCVKITPPEVLAKNHRNMVVHASDLPKGRGFSPLSWMIIEGHNEIPLCLLDAADEVDSGPVVYRDYVKFEGHELIEELHLSLGTMQVAMCRRFLEANSPPQGQPQSGEPSHYVRRFPKDSELDPNATLSDQFDLLRTVDNEKYPAFFYHRGHHYRLTIRKVTEEQ